MSVVAVSMLAFATVLALLSFMAVVMTILTRIFPAAAPLPAAAGVGTDSAAESAIAQAVQSAFPGARISRIREIR